MVALSAAVADSKNVLNKAVLESSWGMTEAEIAVIAAAGNSEKAVQAEPVVVKLNDQEKALHLTLAGRKVSIASDHATFGEKWLWNGEAVNAAQKRVDAEFEKLSTESRKAADEKTLFNRQVVMLNKANEIYRDKQYAITRLVLLILTPITWIFSLIYNLFATEESIFQPIEGTKATVAPAAKTTDEDAAKAAKANGAAA